MPRSVVSLSIINQLNHQEDIRDAFFTDISSPAFEKPQKTRNIGFGAKMFKEVSILDHPSYMKNDRMRIVVRVAKPSKENGEEPLRK